MLRRVRMTRNWSVDEILFEPRIVRANARKLILFAILLGMMGLIALDISKDEGPVRSKSAAAKKSAVTQGDKPQQQDTASLRDARDIRLPERPLLEDPRVELFGSHNWQPPVPTIIARPSTPTAPPMPYRFAGKLLRGDEVSILLSKGDAVFAIKQGQTLDGSYRVESISDTEVTLVYLPLRHQESIPIFSLLSARGSVSASSPPLSGAGPIAATPAVPPLVAAARASSAAAAGSTTPPAARTPESGAARLLWAGPAQVKLGSSFDVALRVTSGQPVQAYPMQLQVDPAQLELVAAKPGKFFSGGDRNFSYRANPDGSIIIGASNQHPSAATDAELLVLTFKPVKPMAVAELTVSSLNLQGPSGRAITFDPLVAFRTVITP